MICLEIYYVVSNVTVCLNSPVDFWRIGGVVYNLAFSFIFFLLQQKLKFCVDCLKSDNFYLHRTKAITSNMKLLKYTAIRSRIRAKARWVLHALD